MSRNLCSPHKCRRFLLRNGKWSNVNWSSFNSKLVKVASNNLLAAAVMDGNIRQVLIKMGSATYCNATPRSKSAPKSKQHLGFGTHLEPAHRLGRRLTT